LLGGLKEVIHLLTPHSWQNYVSVQHFRQRYASDSSERGNVRIANEGDAAGLMANLCFQTGKSMGEVTKKEDQACAEERVTA